MNIISDNEQKSEKATLVLGFPILRMQCHATQSSFIVILFYYLQRSYHRKVVKIKLLLSVT